MAELRKVLLVVNPKAGKASYARPLKYIEEKLDGAGIKYEHFFTKKDGHGLLTRYLKQGSFDELLILGGDGTLNYAVNELAGAKLPISIVSNGTGNDSVRSLHGITSFKEQVEIALSGEIKSYDLGRCNGKYFVNGLGVGFDGKVVQELERGLRGKRSRLDYLRTVLRILYSFHEQEAVFSIDGKPYRRKILLLTISNGTTFGGGFVINPFAKADDGLLDVCILGEIDPLKRFWYLPMLKTGTHHKLKESEFLQARHIRIEASDQLVAHLDGEFFGHPPFDITVHPKALLLRSTA